LHGYLYRDQREEALAEAIRTTLERGRWFSPEILQQQAMRFGVRQFRDGIYKEVEKALQSKRS
jgi:DNA-binding NarL/FixJ family response regulator